MVIETTSITLPGWEVVRKLGEGSFGGVYEIHRTLPDGTVEHTALKKLTVPKDPGEITELYAQSYDNARMISFYAHRDVVSDTNWRLNVIHSLLLFKNKFVYGGGNVYENSACGHHSLTCRGSVFGGDRINISYENTGNACNADRGYGIILSEYGQEL